MVFHLEYSSEQTERNFYSSPFLKFKFKNFNSMKQFIVTVKHDNGKTRIRVAAMNEEAAKFLVMSAERCPECAIVKVREARYNKIKRSN